MKYKVKCTCSLKKKWCDGDCLYQGQRIPTPVRIVVIVLFLLLCAGAAFAQVPVMYSGGSQMQKMERIQPVLWQYADGMDTSDAYCIHRQFDSTNVSVIFLIGFNEEGNENMRLVIDEAYFVPTLNICVVYQNGMEMRLRERMP